MKTPSVEDRQFIQLMDKELFMDDTNSWVAPLPFCSPRQRLPNNREQALSPFNSLCHTLCRKSEMREHFVEFMQRIFDNDHAEPAPPVNPGEEGWYLPSFGVFYPRKPSQICVVFDSSAQFHSVSLNNVLLMGPDLSNSIVVALFHCMVRHGTVHFWGVFHWVLYLVPDTFLVPLRSRFHANRTVTKT